MERLDCDRMFVAVLETGSFARAAQRLGTSSGQASKMISRLEQDLGVRLLNRTTRAIAATEVGQAYFERIRDLLEEIDALDQSVKSQSGAATGKLRLTVPVSFGTSQLIPVLMDFARTYQDIDLDVSFSDRIVSLVDEGFDAAVRVGNPADTSLVARKLCEARLLPGASQEYLDAHGEPREPADLARHVCILDTNVREPTLWRFRDGGHDTTMTVSGRLRFSNAEACLAAAAGNLGIAYLPTFIAGPAFRDGRVVPLLRAHEAPPRGIHVLYPPGRHLAIKVRVLVDFLVSHFRGDPEWDKGW
ncbi:LysR family transcriptional regulator [Aestuariivirga sp.]|uniref:LysR family transcriptional regulator n=1 Tax=Aestuariivirga sp. TaxID=2650926 RepID=UPI0039E559C6